ncbi:uncharacterized protein LOC129618776 isoform X2 [Condylostylus longicornis]|uniref:uncharacterized protein LOC129618776 isoform X2 n=1 Tax=Condylostylus longicornis TaxID=2530218 RepID=UPI00244DBB37|nr:uncharacterized protein LOC129618776 isoform X2 [Condylostylus longicornis]
MDILFVSQKIFLGDNCEDFIDGAILVTTEGKIRQILRNREQVNSFIYNNEPESVIDFKDKILMPGLVDINVNIFEPGRNDWEGFVTATKAAAAGGITTLFDMPIYNVPPTVSAETLKAKALIARGKCFVDVGLWGGITSSNVKNSTEIENLARSGVIGLYCSLCPSQTNEFSEVKKSDIQSISNIVENSDEPKKYVTFLDTRPAFMEKAAVEIITALSVENKSIPIHILNLSCAETLPIIKECKSKGGKLTVETCPHYLIFDSESINDTQTEFKCFPPIRDKENKDKLWKAIASHEIDIISSNHSPTLPGLKCLTYGKTRGNFLKAWSGIASLQLGLSIFWTECRKYGLDIKDVYRLFCKNPTKLCGIGHVKGVIKEGYDADFCVWDPNEEFTVSKEDLFMQNKSTPYLNMRLKGVVYATVVRGLHVYERYSGFGQPLGRIILRRPTKQVVRFS